VSPREGPVKAVFTFEVIDRRGDQLDDDARLLRESYGRPQKLAALVEHALLDDLVRPQQQ
jgi:hypothetical protein